MSKRKNPAPPRQPQASADADDDALAQALADLALDVISQEDEPDTLHLKQDELDKQVRNALRKKNDDLLYGAIELAKNEEPEAYRYLRAQVEETSATVMLRRDGAPTMEVNAFLVPLFVHSKGGLKQDEGFRDEHAYGQLLDSFQKAGLESGAAKVMLIRHAYDLGEIDAVSYSQLNEMVREAAASMTEKKMVATPALERSVAGWSGSGFAPEDDAMELRFLLGFALKRADDPFYIAPVDENEVDDYYAARMERYREWTTLATPLIQRTLSASPDTLELSFLYQDLFYSAKEQGMAELAMLGMMWELSGALEQHGLAPAVARAVIGAADVEHDMVLRVNLYAGDSDVPLASAEKPLDVATDLRAEVDDVADALSTLGITAVAVARRFGPAGEPEGMQPYQPG